MEHTILLIDEVATILRLSKSSVYRMNSQGILRSISTRGGKLRFLVSDVEALLQSQENKAPPVNTTTSSRKRKRDDRSRKEAVAKALDRHRIKNAKGNQES